MSEEAIWAEQSLADYPPATCSDHRTLRSSTAARAKLKEVGPEQTTFPVITDEGATIEDGGRVSSVQKVYVQANISNQYGAFYAQVKYDVKWTDKNGVEHTEQKSTNAYYFKATSDTVFYEAIIPAQKAGSTVYWLIVVTNENGLSSVTEAQQYSVYAI